MNILERAWVKTQLCMPRLYDYNEDVDKLVQHLINIKYRMSDIYIDNNKILNIYFKSIHMGDVDAKLYVGDKFCTYLSAGDITIANEKRWKWTKSLPSRRTTYNFYKMFNAYAFSQHHKDITEAIKSNTEREYSTASPRILKFKNNIIS